MLGPVFHADLRSHSRRARLILLRIGFLCILLCLFLFCYAGLPNTISKKQATVLGDFASHFVFLYMIGQFAFLMLIGPAYVASAIAEEKQRGTLDYLFSSHLTNYEIIVGKYFSRLFLLLQFVFIGLPVLALTQLLGGVSLELILGMLLGTLGCLASLTALSVLFSVISKHGRDALVRTFMVLIFLVGSWFLLHALWQSSWLSAWVNPSVEADIRKGIAHILNLNPVYIALILREHLVVFGNIEGLPLRWFGLCCGLHLIIAAALVGLSVFIVRRRFLSQIDQLTKRNRLVAAYSKPAVWSMYPLYWKERYVHGGSWRLLSIRSWFANLSTSSDLALLLVFGFLISIVCLIVFLALFFRLMVQGSEEMQILACWAILGLLFCSILAVIVRTASGIAVEKDRETWEALVASPVATSDLLLCRLYGGFLSARWLFLFAVVFTFMEAFRPATVVMGYSPRSTAGLVICCVFIISNVGYLIFALGLAGYYSLLSNSSIRNVMSALTVLLMLNLFPLVVLSFYRGGNSVNGLVQVIYFITDPKSMFVILGLGSVAVLSIVLYYTMPRLRWLYDIVKWLGNLLLLNALLLLLLSGFTFAFGGYFPFERVVMFGAPLMLDYMMLKEYLVPQHYPYYGNEGGAMLFMFSSGVTFGLTGCLLYWWSLRKLRRTCERVEYSRLAVKQRKVLNHAGFDERS